MNIPIHKFKNRIAYVDNSPYWTTADYIGWLATEVYDKNGNEVFEGDTVKINGTFAGAVYFHEGAFRAYGLLIKDYADGELEIVGHISEERI